MKEGRTEENRGRRGEFWFFGRQDGKEKDVVERSLAFRARRIEESEVFIEGHYLDGKERN